MQPVMITAALVGAEVTKAQQPYLPITPQEIVQAAVECYKAGAAIIHLIGMLDEAMRFAPNGLN